MKVIIDYDSKDWMLEKIIVDEKIELEIDAIKNKQISDWFMPSKGRDGWEGLIKEIQKAVADDTVDIQWEFWGPEEKKKEFKDILRLRGFTGFENENREEIKNEFLRVARNFEIRGQEQLAFEKYYQAAEGYNDAEAQYKVAEFYAKGYGCEMHKERAVEWYEKAANQGHAEAQNSLGDCYYDGEGVKQDYGKAFEWYEKAANQGHAEAQNSLGDCYYDGEGVECHPSYYMMPFS